MKSAHVSTRFAPVAWATKVCVEVGERISVGVALGGMLSSGGVNVEMTRFGVAVAVLDDGKLKEGIAEHPIKHKTMSII